MLGSDWIGVSVHSTRFKEHLLRRTCGEDLGPDWCAFKEGKEVYLSHKQTVGAVLADTARLQVTENKAEKNVHVGLMLRKYILLQQMSFSGSFN